MNELTFAYDGKVGEQHTWHWHLNVYDKLFYPTNGIWEECYYDYHAPLQTVCEENDIRTKCVTVTEALCSDQPFIYNLTFRYFANTVRNHHAKNGVKGIPSNFNYFRHIAVGIIDAINTGQCLLILNDAHESNYYSQIDYELLKDKLKAANIYNLKNVVLLSGNMSNDIVDSDIKLIKWQYFETAMRLTASYDYKRKLLAFGNKLDNFIHPYTDNFKKFLCLNRVPREIRYYFMYQIYKNNLIHDFNASLKNVRDIEEIVSYNQNAFLDQIKNESKFLEMLSLLPWTIDTTDFNSNHWDNIQYEFKAKNLVFITTETLFSSDYSNLFLTEKTFKPISLLMPFIVIGNPHILKRLRTLGYKTFNDLWDESYDDEFDCQKRIEKIINLVKNLSNNYSTEELYNLIEKNKHIMNHNYNLLISRRPETEVLDYLKQRIYP